jgi:hypothetical protein
MKNKHLVVIFLAVVAVGYIARRLPLPYRRAWSTDLVELDTAAVRQIAVQRPGAAELVFERTERGWSVSQDVRSLGLAPAQVEPLLAALARIRSDRVVKTNRPDTLGLAETAALHVAVYDADGLLESFWLGGEFTGADGAAYTYFRPERHDALYAAEGALRTRFDVRIDDYRDLTAFSLQPQTVQGVALSWRDHAPLYLLRNDTLGAWQTADGRAQWPDTTMQAWLRQLVRLARSRHADFFDESTAADQYVARITLEGAGDPPLVLRFFHLPSPEAPDDLAALRGGRRGLASYVLASSVKPGSYFAVDDTTLAKRLCFGLLPVVKDTMSAQ